MRRGFTLIELIISVVILAVAIPGAMVVLSGMARQSDDARRQTQAVEYTRLRMEQILSKRYDEGDPSDDVSTCTFRDESFFGPDIGETEATYDDVDDFVTTPGGNCPYTAFDGELASDPLPGEEFKTNVVVRYVDLSYGYGTWWDQCPSPPCPSTCVKQVTVRTIDKATGQELAKADALITPYK